MPPVPFADALRVWFKIGLISFGGPAGQIALMHRLIVEERGWISEQRFLHALNFCMLLPGPEAQQLATYTGWLLHKTWGGIIAGVLFILPGFVLIVAISWAYVTLGDLAWMQGLLFGLQCATLAIVVQAVLKVGRKALKHPLLWGIAGLSFLGIFAFNLPFPLIIFAAAGLGLIGARALPAVFAPSQDAAAPAERPAASPPLAWTVRILLAGAALWGLPVLLLVLTLGLGHVFTDQALFFSKMAVVTFGGAYAVLAYMTQQAVERYGWLAPGEMVQGLALAETTPGPLILVLTYVGFLAAWRDPGALSPELAGVMGATLSTWVTFVPCFLWIFLGAPYIERLRDHRGLSAALTAITAAVVGVILNLSLWFALHVLFTEVNRWEGYGLHLLVPVPGSLNLAALIIGAAAILALMRFKIGLMTVLAACAGAGLALA
ncbi:chromate efflux transporter [Polycyclovorans algicola]|uniref:chromate efflux transporter n=1 Tax=Polycyclovorans algicola TaxID=616992 RepID=UPI000AFC4B32|nr:chromate efflux transporter [Polycyclovorans algicola]